jgi:acyl-CoA dehydrogenase
MPHIRNATVCAFARLLAMKLYAYRALDYVQAASADERRFLLFNAVQKARVSTQGVRVIELLTECVGARAFETPFRFESALREAPMIPVLEGSTHINFGLTAQFADSYFAEAEMQTVCPPSATLDTTCAGENPYWFDARDRNAKTVKFGGCLSAYAPLQSVPNVELFTEQVCAFQKFVRASLSSLNPSTNTAVQIALGRCFSAVVYGQLVAENCFLAGIELPIVAVMFQCLLEDLSAEALQLSAHFAHESIQRIHLGNTVRIPRTAATDVTAVANLVATLPGS